MGTVGANRRPTTFQRPQVDKITAPLPGTHHVLENILSNHAVRKALVWLTRPQSDGKCLFEKICAHYDNPADNWAARLRWMAPNLVVDFGLMKAGLQKELMKQKLFHHAPTVKALALTARSIGIHGLSAPQRYAAPLFVVWNFTQACNLTCRHCYQNARAKPLENELSLQEKLDLIDQFGVEMVPFVAFAGGEPLVSRDLWPVLDRCAQRGIHVTIATNGTMLSPENCARLVDSGVKYVEVSLDSTDPAIHDAFRGVPGAWKRTVQGIKNCVATGMRTGLATCFTRHNADTVDDVVQFALDLGCKTFSHFNFIPVGRGREMAKEDLTPPQRERLLHRIQRHMEEGRIGVVSTAPQLGRGCIVYGSQEGAFATGHAGKGAGSKAMVLSRYIGGCGAGRCYCSMQPDGTVTPCVYISSLPVGNIRRKPFREIWDNELFAVLSNREDRSDHCGVCDYRAYCGGCRARALSYTGDIQAGDPGCVYNAHEWVEITQLTGGIKPS